jgi:hypothetical protein
MCGLTQTISLDAVFAQKMIPGPQKSCSLGLQPRPQMLYPFFVLLGLDEVDYFSLIDERQFSKMAFGALLVDPRMERLSG